MDSFIHHSFMSFLSDPSIYLNQWLFECPLYANPEKLLLKGSGQHLISETESRSEIISTMAELE